MKLWYVVAFCIVCFFSQPTLAGIPALWGKGPDLLLCLTVTAIFCGKNPGPVIILTVITAAVSEVCFSLYAGPEAVGIFLVSLCASAAASYCRWDGFVFFLIFTIFGTLLYEVTAWAGMILLGAPRSFLHLLRIMVPTMLYNVGIMLIVWKGYIKKVKGREGV